MRVQLVRFSCGLICAAIVSMSTGAKGWAEEPLTPVNGAPADYRLVGTVEGSPEVTFAVFENPQTKKQSSYRIGDVINSATIVEIKEQHVLLKRGAQFVTVYITGGSDVVEKPSRPESTRAEEIAPAPEVERVLSKQLPPYSSAVQKMAVADGLVTRLSGQLVRYAEKPALFAETSFGKGIRAADLGENVATSLGLDINDVIVGISGMGIDSPERLGQIIEILNRAKVFNLSVIHGSNAQSMAYEREKSP
jgi:type II secretory pathway component PulC